MERILVVDDEKNILLVISKSLEIAGYDVIKAKDGLEAVEKAGEEDPDLILLDLRLPKMNGFLVLEAIKDDEQTTDIPVIVISARSTEEDFERVFSLGACDYLVKPIDQKTLLNAVEKYLEGGNENGKKDINN